MNNLKAAREAVGLTQKQVANKVGIAHMSYIRYETPKYQRDPNVKIAIKIADALEIKDLRDIWNITE